eukprot:TRINITY_DN12951_c0_g1_i2.p1 TRINITY_DN12951_c0_g1~~TRINITY_DN12951_c0_g1_i2.p1  ORF type:complete len:199 (-),score=18.67 TRINITY_DN12951_c0_g1_i2:350-946(-)
MFYSQELLAHKGLFATVWQAGTTTNENRLRRRNVEGVPVSKLCRQISAPIVALALRLRAILLLGVIRVFATQVRFLFEDCQKLLFQVRKKVSANPSVTLEESTVPVRSITFDLNFSSLEIDLLSDVGVIHPFTTKSDTPLQRSREIEQARYQAANCSHQVGPNQINLLCQTDLIYDRPIQPFEPDISESGYVSFKMYF